MNVLHYPNLKTVLMIENTLKKSNTPLTREQLKAKLKTKIMHQTLNVTLKYLEDSGKILDGRKGISWIQNDSPKLQKAIKEGTKWENLKENQLISLLAEMQMKKLNSLKEK